MKLRAGMAVSLRLLHFKGELGVVMVDEGRS